MKGIGQQELYEIQQGEMRSPAPGKKEPLSFSLFLYHSYELEID